MGLCSPGRLVRGGELSYLGVSTLGVSTEEKLAALEPLASLPSRIQIQQLNDVIGLVLRLHYPDLARYFRRGTLL